MKTSVRTAVLIAVYTFFVFVFFVVRAFFIKELPNLVSADITYWRFISGTRDFLFWLPSILASVCCIAFSWAFSKNAAKNLVRFSPVQVKNYKTVLLIAGISVIVCFVSSEVLIPVSSARKTQLESRIRDYTWYFEQAQVSLEEGNISAACFYADNALALCPANSDAKKLRDDCQRFFGQGGQDGQRISDSPSFIPSQIAAIQNSPYATMFLLQKAQKAFDLKKFFDAHYYAWWGLKLAGENEANSAELRRLAVDSWNIISSWSGFETDETARIFLKKKEGYNALMEGDVLGAYYIFFDLCGENDHDPDILRFYRLSTEALSQQYFFIDETRNLAFFETLKNITFKVKYPNGTTSVISIGGVTTVPKTDNFIKYLRDYSCLSYAADGHLLQSMTVPYVKLIGQKAGTLGVDYAKRTGIRDPQVFVPRLLFTSMSRENRNMIGSARCFSAQGATFTHDIVQILPLSVQDFDLACRASCKGPLYMNLAFLFRFVPIADRYGFPQRVYSLFLIQRLCRPLLLFALFMFLAIVAWNYKLESSQVFRFVWVFSFPVFTAVLQFCSEFFRYLINLVYYALTALPLFAHLPVAVGTLFLLIVFLSLRFLALHKA